MSSKPSSDSVDEVQSAFDELKVENPERQPDDEQPEEEYDEDMTVEEARAAKEEGNKLFGSGKWAESVTLYTRAMRCSKVESEERAVFYCNRAAARLKLSEHEGVVDDCSRALKMRPGYTKALMRRMTANENLENYEPALEDLKALEESAAPSDRSGLASNRARLEGLKAKKEEKQKEEAIKQLKEAGNSFLSMFGMSVDNFKFDKDPATGSYNIKFSQGGS